jgi:hypothetical protein
LNNVFIFYFKLDILKQKWKRCDINIFYYKVSFLIKSDGNLFLLHVQSCTFNFLFKFDGFLGRKWLEGREGFDWHESTRLVYIEMLEVAPNQYDTFIWHVDMYLLAWRLFSKLGSFIEFSLKSFPSAGQLILLCMM